MSDAPTSRPHPAQPPTADAAWHAALAFALTGERLRMPAVPRPDAAQLLAALDAQGWTQDRIAAHARSLSDASQPWPHQVPDDLRAGLGAAQLRAALGEARRRLGLTSLETRPPSQRTSLTPHERRLLAEVPPHHVG